MHDIFYNCAQGDTLLGMKADEVAALKEAEDPAAYRALLNAKQFSHWSLVLLSRSTYVPFLI